jgi:hypothetical protein
MKTSKVFDTGHFDKDAYFSKLLEAVRSKKITNKDQVYKILQVAKLTDHNFVDWFFDKLDKNKVAWKDLENLIDLDFFPRTFVIRKLDYLDKLETAPQAFQEKYARVLKDISKLEKLLNR